MNTYHVRVADEEYVVTLATDGSVFLDGERCNADIKRSNDVMFTVLLGEESVSLGVLRGENSYEVVSGGVYSEVHVESERTRLLREYAGTSGSLHHRFEVHAPMPALVVRVEVKVGDEVQPGQGLIVLEAMKMENELRAHHAGRVKEIHVAKGKTVEKGELLLLLE